MGEEEVITFVGESLAKKDFAFVFRNVNSFCPDNCTLLNTCMKNLNPHTAYQIIDVMKKEMKCPNGLHEEKMRLVKVKPIELYIVIEKKNLFLGSTTAFHPMGCGKSECENYPICHPNTMVIKPGQKVKMIKEVAKVKNCENNRTLSIVKVKRVD